MIGAVLQQGTWNSGTFENPWLVFGLAVCLALPVGASPADDVAGGTPLSPASQPATDKGHDIYSQITVFGQNSWFLCIYPSGGGAYGFGDGGSPFSSTVPRGTFKFDEVLAQAREVSEESNAANLQEPQRKSEPGWYSVAISRRGSSLAEMRNTRNADFVKELYERALAASPPGQELARVLATRPPFPGATTQPAPTTNPRN